MFHALGAVLISVFACGVFAITASAAPVFLLAEWLLNGKTVLTELSVEIEGELELTDNKVPLIGSATILCSGKFTGWVGPNSLARISEFLTLSGVAVTGDLTGEPDTCTAVKGCETSTSPLIWVFGFPKEVEVELMEVNSEVFFVSMVHGEVGWHISNCLVLGVSQEDLCTSEEFIASPSRGRIQLVLLILELIVLLSGLKLATCTQGGNESGVIEGTDEFKPDSAEELGVSSDGVEE
jgi:hypothetical protein